jgi:pimeloyl-ACP methyl ester carboxylesterase
MYSVVRSATHCVFALLAPLGALAGSAVTGAEARVEEMAFVSHGARLSGSIVFPDDLKPHSAVVFIHGSGEQTRNLTLAKRFAAAGIAALVYDKRGVGKSGGEYESRQSVSGMNISLLADDASAALQALASHPSLKGVPVGLAGISQAGWIAPLAAERNRGAKFLVLWSGPVCKVSEEDIYSKYTADTSQPIVPAYQEALDARTEKYIWPDFLGEDTDPVTSLRKLSIPGLWIFSDNDGSIPVDLSLRRLNALRSSAPHYDYALFSGLGHDNMEGTFAAAIDWIRRASK